MQNDLKKLLQRENPRKPYTDDQLARLLGIRREHVVELRHQAGVPDSRERIKPGLRRDCAAILRENPSITDRALTSCLNELGYSVSRYLVKNIRQELPRPQKEEVASPAKAEPIDGETDFSGIIGWDGALKAQITQAKAAIAYPPNGLHTLIIGPSGTGKTLLAECMYRYAVHHGFLPADAPYISFNCADYADNPQLLVSQLFGYVKGAFSGADKTKSGLVEAANGGVLFLDEIHRLPSEGQELLFFLLDKGSYRPLGDSGAPRFVNVRLIAATTSMPESSLLLTFRRRIPVVISMPDLASRPLKERYAIVRNFFAQEAAKLKRPLVVSPQAINILLQYSCPGNVGQLHSDIQVCCANSFLESMSSNQNEIYLKPELVETLLHTNQQLRYYRQSGGGYFWKELVLSGEELTDDGAPLVEESIYQMIQDHLNQLQESGMDDEESLRVVRARLSQQLRLFYHEQQDSVQPKSRDNVLKDLVDPLLWDTVQRAVEKLKDRYSQMDDNLLGVLAIHLDSVVRSLAGETYRPRVNVEGWRQKYPQEYIAARELLAFCSERIGLKLPEEEAAVVAMYLHTFSSHPPGSRVRVIVLTHGEVGKAMAETANKMLRDDNAVGITMDLEESSEQALERTVQTVQAIDEGKGCLLLVDMGSLASFAPEVELRTGVRVRCVARVDTLMVLDAIRRADLSEEYTLDELADALEKGRMRMGLLQNSRRTNRPPAILTVCATGEGNARRVHSFIEATIPECSNIHIEEIGLLDRQSMLSRVEQIAKEYEVLVVIGTMNPNLPGIPFLAMNYVFSSHGTMTLNNLLAGCSQHQNTLSHLLHPGLILCNVDFADKNEALDKMSELLVNEGCVTSDFQLSVYKRENMGATCLPQGVAIPHGDTAFVTKPAICVAKTSRSIEWSEDCVADFVFMFALDENCMESIQDFYKIIVDEKRLNCLKQADSTEEILNALTK